MFLKPMNKKIMTAALAWALVVPLLRSQTIDTVTSASAGLYEPYGVSVDLTLNAYYFTDSANNRVIRLQPKSGKIAMLAEGQLSAPQGIAVTKSGIYITESATHSIVRMTSDGEITLFAGGSRGANNGAGPTAQFNSPAGIAADASGNLYVADLKNDTIRLVTPLGEVSTYASGFNEPSGVAVDDKGVVYVADTRNHVIKRISAPGAQPELVAGKNKQPGTDDGFGGDTGAATFNNPRGLVWVGGETGLLVADTGNHSIRRVYLKGGLWRVETVAGRSGEPGFTAGDPAVAQFNGPIGLAVDAEGSILICDLYNNALRVMKRPAVETPEISPVSGSYSNAVTLAITSKTTNTLFRYTLDGSDPSPLSTSTTGNLDLDRGPLSVRLRGYSADFGTSVALSNRYSFFVAPAVMLPAGGSFTNDTLVSISGETKSADLRFTTDGSVPVIDSKKWETTTATISSNVTLRVRGFRTGFDPSTILSNRFDFIVSPLLISLPGGVFKNEVNIVVKTLTDSADLRYTLDGTEPTEQSLKWKDGLLVNGPLKVKGIKSGYTSSASISNLFRLVVADPTVVASSFSSSNAITVGISSETTGAALLYTLDGTDPATNGPTSMALVGSKLVLDRNGPLKIRGFKEGFESSAIFSTNVVLKVATPVTTPGSTNSFNPLSVTLTDGTDQARVYWTIDGKDPTELNGTLFVAGAPIELATSGVFKARAYRSNFVPSEISSADFRFHFATPKFETAGGTNVNEITFAVASETLGLGLYYTTDGKDPTKASLPYVGLTTLTTSAVVKVVGIRDGFTSSSIISADFWVKAPKPTMSPSSGYFPNGALVTLGLSLARADAQIRYTLDGSDPNANSVLYSAPFSVNQVVSQGQDLRQVRVRTFAPNTLPSDIVSGQPVDENVLGVPRDMSAGIGSTIVVPVVLNLKTNLILRSLQFVVEVSPDTPTTKSLANELRGLSFLTNDFVRVAGSGSPTGPPLYTTSPYRSGAASRLAVSAIGTNANFSVTDFGTVALLAVTIPPNSVVGDRYKIQILEPSGTTNALQAKLILKGMEPRFIVVTNIAYIVGDTATGNWYNSGEFGDGNLDNSDVNNAFYASLGIRIPFSFSDVFDAMDAYPDDDDGAVGGDGQLRFLDWQRILQKSLRRDTKNWRRQWSAGGSRVNVAAVLSAPASLSATVQRGFASRDVWYRQAVVRAGTLARVEPGATVDVPVYLDVRKENSIAGLQFKIQVESDGAKLESPIAFVPSKGIPRPLTVDGLSLAETVASWPLVPSAAFTPALRNASVLGTVRVKIPASASKGQRYTIHFLRTDGSPDENTQYEIESLPGSVWVGVEAQSPPENISDEWKEFYFGGLLDPQLASDGDSDGDGASNLAEYLAGTNPVNAKSRLQLSIPGIRRSGGAEEVVLRWQTTPGRSYVVEWAADVQGGEWNVLADNVDGDGEVHEVTTPPLAASASFYRVRLKN